MNASRLKRALAAIAATAVVLIFAMPAARAVHLESFQLDGDVKEATCGGAFGTLSCDPSTTPPGTTASAVDDWNSLYSCPSSGTGPCTKITSGHLAVAIGDLVIDVPDVDQFTQGSKDDMNVSAWNWVASGSGSDKTNLYESFAAKYADGSLYIGANRVINNGDANIGMWLLQNATLKCTAEMVAAGQCATAGTFVGKPNAQGFSNLVPHKISDILIVSAFTNGGTVSNIQVYKVVQTVGNGSNPNAVPGVCPANAIASQVGKNTGSTGICLQQLITSTQQGAALCNSAIVGPPAIPGDAACAATNTASIPALDTRFSSPQNGAIPGEYPPLTFFEVGLNLVDLGLGTECFPTYLVDGRQSQSVTSALNDFTLGSFQNCESGIVTQASGPVTLGASISDTATLDGSGGVTPTGTITFNAYSDSQCTTKVFGPNAVTVNGFGNYTSGSFTPSAAGTYYWIASYSGDSNFPAANGACGDANESSVVNKAPTTLSTTASGPVVLGNSIFDTAHISGLIAPISGNITFKLYSSQAACVAGSQALFTSTKPVTANGDVTSDSYTPSATGSYYWTASYDGDANNSAVAASCTEANETSVITVASPGITTVPRVQVINNDSATLTGLVSGVAPTGSITFNLYKDSPTCSLVPPTKTQTVSVNGAGPYSTTFGIADAILVTADTIFRWTVSYTGDTNYAGATSTCGVESVGIDITPNPAP